jgi:hypothetical protein
MTETSQLVFMQNLVLAVSMQCNNARQLLTNYAVRYAPMQGMQARTRSSFGDFITDFFRGVVQPKVFPPAHLDTTTPLPRKLYPIQKPCSMCQATDHSSLQHHKANDACANALVSKSKVWDTGWKGIRK